MERCKGTFTQTMTGFTRMPKSEWYWRLGRKFGNWLAKKCGEPQYHVSSTSIVNYRMSADGKLLDASGKEVKFTYTL